MINVVRRETCVPAPVRECHVQVRQKLSLKLYWSLFSFLFIGLTSGEKANRILFYGMRLKENCSITRLALTIRLANHFDLDQQFLTADIGLQIHNGFGIGKRFVDPFPNGCQVALEVAYIDL